MVLVGQWLWLDKFGDFYRFSGFGCISDPPNEIVVNLGLPPKSEGLER